MTDTAARPRQVSFAAWLIVIGSGAVLIAAYDALQSLHSLGSQADVRRMLKSFPGTGMGIDDVLRVMHVLDLIAAGCAVATLILGFYVLRRDRSARLAVTILAVPLFLCGLSADGVFSTVVAVASAWLWGRPARDWFAATPGGAGSTAPASPAAGEQRRSDEVRSDWGRSGSVRSGWASLPTRQPYGSAEPQAAPPASGDAGESGPTGRPRLVVVAALIVWVCTVLSAALMIVGAGLVIHDPHRVLHSLIKSNPSLASDGLDASTLRIAVVVAAAVIVAWCAGAATLAVLVWRRIRWAWRPLVASTMVSAIFLLLSILTNPFAILPLICAAVTIRLLLRPEVKAWLRRPGDVDRRPRVGRGPR